MNALNFYDEPDDNETAIRALARDAYDLDNDRLDFSDALDALGLDDELRRALEELDEDEAVEIYEDAYDDMEESWTD